MFSERFRVARARKNLTLRDVGQACGVSAQAVMKWETGKAHPSSSSLLKFVKMADVSVEWLMCPDPLDFKSTLSAPNGVHIKDLVREVLQEIAMENLARGLFTTRT